MTPTELLAFRTERNWSAYRLAKELKLIGKPGPGQPNGRVQAWTARRWELGLRPIPTWLPEAIGNLERQWSAMHTAEAEKPKDE